VDVRDAKLGDGTFFFEAGDRYIDEEASPFKVQGQ
jgi:hypothetical protein